MAAPKARRYAAVLAAATLVAACSNEGLKQELMAATSKGLVDPPSVQFKDLRLESGGEGGPVLCGEVNAKDRTNAHVGFRPFATTKTESFVCGSQELPSLAQPSQEVADAIFSIVSCKANLRRLGCAPGGPMSQAEKDAEIAAVVERINAKK